jgi:lipid-binding SYLF domain-containing protein
MTLLATLAIAPLLANDDDSIKRLNEASAVFSEIMAAPDKGIPQDLLADAHCIVIVPSLKTAAFLVGGKYGKGYLSCRSKSGEGWSAPGTVRIEGGSVGFQIGGSTTDLIMLVMNERGVNKLLSSKFTLGAEGSVAAGPVGRTPKCTPRSSRGRGLRGCSPASRWKAPLCGKTWTITPSSMAEGWRTGRS